MMVPSVGLGQLGQLGQFAEVVVALVLGLLEQ
jgi:hypothetical protein